MGPMRGRRWITTATCLALCLLLVGASLAEAAPRRGVQRHYVGARWVPRIALSDVHAVLNLRTAYVRDFGRGGFVAQTLWAATNGGVTRFGRNRRTPYVQVAVTRGYRGRNSMEIVCSQRNTRGTYYEGRTRGPRVRRGKGYYFSIHTGRGKTTIMNGGKELCVASNAGSKNYTGSVFAGVESSSRRTTGIGTVSKLRWGAGRFSGPVWRFGSGKGRGGKAGLVRRGCGRVGWIRRQESLRDQFGPLSC